VLPLDFRHSSYVVGVFVLLIEVLAMIKATAKSAAKRIREMRIEESVEFVWSTPEALPAVFVAGFKEEKVVKKEFVVIPFAILLLYKLHHLSIIFKLCREKIG